MWFTTYELLSNTLDFYYPEYSLKETPIWSSQAVVAFFFKYLKSCILAFAGGPPPCPPRHSVEGRPIGQEIMQDQWGQFCKNQLSIEKFQKFFLKFSAAAAMTTRRRNVRRSASASQYN